MRLISFRGDAGEVRSGVLDGDLVIDLAAAAPLALVDADQADWDLLTVLRGTLEGVSLESAGEILAAVRDSFRMFGGAAEALAYGAGFTESGYALVQPLAQVSLLPPLPQPMSLREYDATTSLPHDGVLPPFRYANHLALIGAHQSVFAPAGGLVAVPALALVVGRGGRNIAVEDAFDHLAGLMLTCGWQYPTPSPRRPRELPTSCGPWLATLDELEMYLDDDGVFNLDVTLAVDGQRSLRTNSRFAGFRPAELLADVSQDVDLLPGDLICWPLGPHPTDEDAVLSWGRRVTLQATALGTIEAVLD